MREIELSMTEFEYLSLCKRHGDLTINVDGDLSSYGLVNFVCEDKDLRIRSRFNLVALNGFNSKVLSSDIELIEPVFSN